MLDEPTSAYINGLGVHVVLFKGFVLTNANEWIRKPSKFTQEALRLLNIYTSKCLDFANIRAREVKDNSQD
ncbi:hypothetical protein KAZ57_02350 [Patescibacteria group bacterium]|nr:hypothetical protein [Patescibacteria group bacterium]